MRNALVKIFKISKRSLNFSRGSARAKVQAATVCLKSRHKSCGATYPKPAHIKRCDDTLSRAGSINFAAACLSFYRVGDFIFRAGARKAFKSQQAAVAKPARSILALVAAPRKL